MLYMKLCLKKRLSLTICLLLFDVLRREVRRWRHLPRRLWRLWRRRRQWRHGGVGAVAGRRPWEEERHRGGRRGVMKDALRRVGRPWRVQAEAALAQRRWGLLLHLNTEKKKMKPSLRIFTSDVC